jgi:cytochrome b pre-mRNA-processing protein 3
MLATSSGASLEGRMLGFLFRTLTAEPGRGEALFTALTAKARKPHWYIEGAVPDTLDGRFAVLATVSALALVRIEQFGEEGNSSSVALTERFIEVMEAEHRELGLGDPTLGKTVRKLVGSLARRVELWRSAVANSRDWAEVTGESLYKDNPSAAALAHSSGALRDYWTKLQRVGLPALIEGRLR